MTIATLLFWSGILLFASGAFNLASVWNLRRARWEIRTLTAARDGLADQLVNEQRQARELAFTITCLREREKNAARERLKNPVTENWEPNNDD